MEALIFKHWCRIQNLSAEDFEEYEEWVGYEDMMKEVIHCLLFLPIRDAWKMAEEDGWTWKRYKELADAVATYS